MTDLHRHLTELIVVGFNSNKYDLSVLKDILIPYLVHPSFIDLVIKRHHAYLALRTGSLKLVNISNFVVAGTSYCAFLQSPLVSGGERALPLRACAVDQSDGGTLIATARGLPLLVEEERVERRGLRRLPESLGREKHANPRGRFGLVQ